MQIILSKRDFDRCLAIQSLPVYESKSQEESEEETKVIELNQLLASPSTSQVKIVSQNNSPVRIVAPVLSRAESERKATQRLDEESPFSAASTQEATPSRLVRTDTDLETLLDDMMAPSPSVRARPQIKPQQKTNDFLQLASEPVPERKHWAEEAKACENIDDKFIKQPKVEPAAQVSVLETLVAHKHSKKCRDPLQIIATAEKELFPEHQDNEIELIDARELLFSHDS